MDQSNPSAHSSSAEFPTLSTYPSPGPNVALDSSPPPSSAPDINHFSQPFSIPASSTDGPSLHAIGGSLSTSSPTLVTESGDVVYETFKAIIEALKGPAGIVSPIKTAVEAVSSIVTIIDVRVPLSYIYTSKYSLLWQKFLQNKENIRDLTRKLEATTLLVECYQNDRFPDTPRNHVKTLS